MIVREPTLAPSRRNRGDAGDEPEADAKPSDAKPAETKSEAKPDATPADAKPAGATATDAKPAGATPIDAKPAGARPIDAKQDETQPVPTKPTPIVDMPRATTEVALPIVTVGRPPDMPQSVAPPPLALGAVEEPTHMPGPKDIPSGEPTDPAPAPGRVPRGDSRSLRRGGEFALVYRVGTYVISRFGTVGQRGQWRVVEYPTSSSASHSYAKECSRFVSEGFSDYRD